MITPLIISKLTTIESKKARSMRRLDYINILPISHNFLRMIMTNSMINPVRPMRQIFGIFHSVFPILQSPLIRCDFKVNNGWIQLLHFTEIRHKLPNFFRFCIFNDFLILVSLISRKEEEIGEKYSNQCNYVKLCLSIAIAV